MHLIFPHKKMGFHKDTAGDQIQRLAVRVLVVTRVVVRLDDAGGVGQSRQ